MENFKKALQDYFVWPKDYFVWPTGSGCPSLLFEAKLTLF